MSDLPDIQVTELNDRLSIQEIEGLVGAVVNVCVGGEFPAAGMSFAEFFRFARVLTTALKAEKVDLCPRCESRDPKFDIEVEWESGYKADDGPNLCELCIDGIVLSGAEHISFGESAEKPKVISVSMTYDAIK